ncbi:MAG: DNA topoisomerase 4 subunit A [Bacteroidia bacterium]|nr:DNA topoisomerase 4 subunit A [Bacteroidia bacterium]MBX3105439.1 DNA gyrase/topoisomerase IV subunit A [Bacteroidota bacterium]MCW5931255.1 DNA gyrase/topoisomerase IV subunit A [Bacteroidota bacterium]
MSKSKDKNKQAPKEQLPSIAEQPTRPISSMYQNWFLDYASYVILERAVPYLDDGLKPVQRRILHSMWEMEDGRYNKVANIIGNTMKYHPHGDASIGDALTQIGQRDLLIDTQGNWGNIYTGDAAAAPRYIEARLSKFALDVVYNPKTTVWQLSYDGRNKEPVSLPVKFPLLLASGVEGIAVGLACKILPHNFCELIQGSIDVLRKKKTNILPDFATGGIADFRNYNEGIRGGRIKVRAVIEQKDRKTLLIKQIPFGTTTSSLIESILAANDKGKIKIKKVEDNTAAEVEIAIYLHPDSSEDIDKTIEALYAFTNCEVSISPNSCVIRDGKPEFMSVNDILKESTFNTVELLKRELEIELSELMEDWHFSSLEKIFIENRIYRKIEECETWEAVIKAIDKGLTPFKKMLKREVTEEDIVKLTEIKIKRISKFDSFKADEHIKALNEKIKGVKENLKNLTSYAITYFKELLKKYGKGRERKTLISEEGFEQIEVRKVVINNAKLYVNREEGFAGYGMKKDELVSECSDIDDVLALTGDGKFVVNKIADKGYYGKDIRFIKIFEKNDEGTVYNMVYRDGARGDLYIKRFVISGVTREKVYDLTKGSENSKVVYLGVSGVNDAPTIQIILKPRPKLKNTTFNVNFNEILIKNRSAIGNILTKFPVHKITEVSKPKSSGSSETPKESKKTDKESEPDIFEFNANHSKKPEAKKSPATQRVQMKMEI